MSELITTWATVIISVIAMVVAISSMIIQRRHNKLSVKPIGEIRCADYENHLAVRIRNNGVGPLICKRLNILKGDGFVGNHLIDLMPELPDDLSWNTFTKKENFSIPAGETMTLLSYEGDEKDDQFVNNRDEIRMALKGLTVVMEYTNIYNETMPKEIRKLDWFAR